MHSCAYPASTTPLPAVRPHSCSSLSHRTCRESDFLTSTHKPLATRTGVQIPQRTASAANASGFLLVSLSKTPRISIFTTRNVRPEAFPIKASDHTPGETPFRSRLLAGATPVEIAELLAQTRL